MMAVGGGGDDGWVRVMVAAMRDGCRWRWCWWLGMCDGSCQYLSVVVVSGGGCETKRKRNTTQRLWDEEEEQVIWDCRCFCLN